MEGWRDVCLAMARIRLPNIGHSIRYKDGGGAAQVLCNEESIGRC